MRFTKKLVMTTLLIGGLGLTVFGCSEGPAERAGKKVDQTVEDTGEKLEEAGDKIEKKAD